ncbi:MAG: mechanosensitive ion channel domain-containing protein [Phycisphaerales bacterium JB065]
MSDQIRRHIFVFVSIAAALCCGDVVRAQFTLDDLTGQGDSQGAVTEEMSVEDRIARVQAAIPKISAELNQTRAVYEAERSSESPVGVEELGNSVSQLRQLLFLHEQLVTEYQQLQEMRELSESAEDALVAAQAGRYEQLPPYTFRTLDDLLTNRLAMRALLRRSEADLSRARAGLVRARDRLAELESQRRSITEQSADAADPLTRTLLARRRELALISERVGDITLELRAAERDQSAAQAEFARKRLDTINRTIDYVEPRVRFTQDDLEQMVNEVSSRQDRLSEIFEQVQEETERVARQLDAWKADSANGEQSLEKRIAIGTELLIVLRARSEITGDRRSRMVMLREGWTDRYQLETGSMSLQQIAALKEQTKSLLAGLDSDELALSDRSRQLRARLIAIQDEAASANDEYSQLIAQRLAAYRGLAGDIDGALEGIELTRQLYLKLDDDLDKESGISIWDRVVIAWSYIAKIWTYGIIQIDDSTTLTVGKLILGLALLALAFHLSRWIAGFLSARVMPRLGLHAHAVSAFKSIAFYILLLTFTLMALRIINVPLTIFAVLGGAVAIGIGFGSQTIASNFISGLILLAERPVRVGDFIDVGGIVGTVQQIGARSTRIKTPTNIEMILPNSTLLDNNLINWTLTDQTVWLTVEVGIAYGSNTREATKLLMKAAEEHGRVLKVPPPRVNFDSFGDNSLNFKLFFAINLNQPGDRLLIPSDLRYRTDNLFRDAGIVIAFPQRDVHLDTLSPLKVELKRANRDAEQASAEEPSQA